MKKLLLSLVALGGLAVVAAPAQAAGFRRLPRRVPAAAPVVHRQVYHCDIHPAYPMTWWEHERLHRQLRRRALFRRSVLRRPWWYSFYGPQRGINIQTRRFGLQLGF